ncbi:MULTISPECIES: AMP-binding protein [unclassified Chelatococcus]|uniref:class I adenylate-forming enzyme family protein n=1 Tax=unclassified Chelatococcus TaxID=2638111 RepID=UPI001BCC50DF|nr:MULTISPECIES: AMP-binding protein [unclassified Chelatococcus]MBS7699673.1 AMP-binding protein [Chelatococcus sp. YT9]MBX3557129.1 AMP-binding protein [Chelatococcus sp.]
MLTGDMLRRSAERFPRKPAILWQGTSLSYQDLDLAANRLANALIGLGLAKGRKVGIISRNRTEYGITFFGAARSGGVLVNISVLYAPEELQYVLDKADVEILIFEHVFAEKIAAVRASLPKIRTYICVGGRTEGAVDFEKVLASGAPDCPKVEIHEDEPFSMTYTGGTTGRPKGVLTSHRNRMITAHTVMVEEAIDERDVVGIVTPLFHVAALNIMFQPAVLAGATSTFLSKWNVADFAAMARATGMTAAFMVPTQASMVISDPAFDADNFKTWTKLSFAGAPMPDWVQRDLLAKLPALKLTQIYGQSEVGVLTVLRHWNLPAKLGSVGRQAYNIDLAVVDREGNPVKAGEIGELVSRGENVMIEYYNEPEQTANFFRNGWGWTGDLATVDEDGFVTLVDRSKDMIISGGENVYPKEIENVLYEHPSVAECAVFGIPDEKWGEVPAAYIQIRTGGSVTEDDLVAHCAERLARFKRPRVVKFVQEFPKTPIGKIQKNFLREPYWKDREKKI